MLGTSGNAVLYTNTSTNTSNIPDRIFGPERNNDLQMMSTQEERNVEDIFETLWVTGNKESALALFKELFNLGDGLEERLERHFDDRYATDGHYHEDYESHDHDGVYAMEEHDHYDEDRRDRNALDSNDSAELYSALGEMEKKIKELTNRVHELAGEELEKEPEIE